MLLRVYQRDDFERARCTECFWISDRNFARGDVCPNCQSPRLTHFPTDQSAHIVGGMMHFIDSYNKKITTPRHIFPPECYLPLVFACSNYETLLHDLVRGLLNKYGSYVGRLGRKMFYQDEYDKKENERLFKQLTLRSIQEIVEGEFPDFFPRLHELYRIRNQVVHGNGIDNTQWGLTYPNKAIDVLLDSMAVFRYLNNLLISKFEANVDYRKVIGLGEQEPFSP